VTQAASSFRAALQVFFVRSGAGEKRFDRSKLLGSGAVRGAGDRKLLLREVVPSAGEGQCLEGLGGRAHERHEPGVAPSIVDLSVMDPGRVDTVP
jgi:hypothetical protein